MRYAYSDNVEKDVTAMDSALRELQIRTARPRRKDAAPRMPHERDESDDSQETGGPRDDIKQAYEDLENGLIDTDLRGLRGVERVVDKTPDQTPGQTPLAKPDKG
ncbi:MAG TPA: hypothetical protein VHK70_00715 [Burkholderiaceae bacterium]|nr:hypothetical protein [Burkholderiaceae bacterium]